MDKESSFRAKGIAIILMLMHHLFYSADVVAYNSRGAAITPLFFSFDRLVVVAQASKVCVAVFVFITGYASYINAKSMSEGGGSTRRYLKLLSNYIPIFVIFFVLGLITGNRSPLEVYFEDGGLLGISYILIDFLGLASAFNTPTLNPTWWYISLATLLIYLLPPFVALAKKRSSVSVLALFVLIPLMVGMGSKGIITVYLPCAALGMVFAQYDLFGKVRSLASGRRALPLILHLLLLCLLLWLRVRINEFLYILDPLIAALICGACIYVRDFGVLAFVGKQSSNIFMMHTFLFKWYLGAFIYATGLPVVTLLIGLLVTLGLSVLLEQLKIRSGYKRGVDALLGKVRI